MKQHEALESSSDTHDATSKHGRCPNVHLHVIMTAVSLRLFLIKTMAILCVPLCCVHIPVQVLQADSIFLWTEAI